MDVTAVGYRSADTKFTAQHQKHFIFVSVGMPGKLATHTNRFQKLSVQLGNDLWTPKLRESLADGLQRHWQLHGTLPSYFQDAA